MNALQHRQSSYLECHRWMGGKAGGRDGSRERQRNVAPAKAAAMFGQH